MAAVTLAPEDLMPFADIDVTKATAMIEDAMALAARVAPCITTAQFEHAAAAKAILRGAVLRWHEAGTGALTQRQESAGVFSRGESYDTRQTRRGMFWPSEITELQALCRVSSESPPAFTVDTTPAGALTDGGYWAQPNLWVPLNGA